MNKTISKNRVIKFRVWNKKDSRLYYPEKFSGYFAINISGDILGFNSETKSFEYLNEEDYITQQFTGLLDKNGKEIYEGDILISLNDLFEKHYKEVFFYNGTFHTRYKSAFYDTFPSPLDQEHSLLLEICGNIFENLALLENCKKS